jgi:dTDP-4-amino-4,6-dideoxygalactose transaminase
MKAFKDITPGQFRVADHIAAKTLGLPFYRDLTAEHSNQIHNLIENNLS